MHWIQTMNDMGDTAIKLIVGVRCNNSETEALLGHMISCLHDKNYGVNARYVPIDVARVLRVWRIRPVAP